MLSIIICSVSPERLCGVQQNIKDTIGVGVDYEIISIDNQEKHWPIAKVYNHGARQAKYPYLFFVHEDVKFHSQGWADFIEQKLAEPDCGVIGFAGSKVKVRAYSGWTQARKWNVQCYYQRVGSGFSEFYVEGAYLQHPFKEVVVVDGFAMFVRRDIWVENLFDEQILTDFHCYDLDFSMQISQNYKNYICCAHILIEHFSAGAFSGNWFSETIRLHANKWNHYLPLKTSDIGLTERDLAKEEESVAYYFLFKLLRSDASNEIKKKILIEFWHRPFSWGNFIHCLSCTLKYLRSV